MALKGSYTGLNQRQCLFVHGRGWLPWMLLALASATMAALLLERTRLAFSAHHLQWAQDLAFFNQILFAASEGRAWTSSLLLEPTGFFQMVHFHPVLALILPFYLLWPGPLTLLYVNVLVVLSGVFPLAALARDRSGSSWFALAAGLAFLSWLPVQTAALADFRPMAFMVPGFLLVLWGLVRPSWLMMFAGALLTCCAREESSYLLVWVGLSVLVLPPGRSRRRHGAALAAVGLTWFLVLLLVKGNLFYHFNPLAFLSGAQQVGLADQALTRDRTRHLALLLLGGGSATLLSPSTLLMCVGPLLYLLATPAKEWQAFTGNYAFYRDVLIPFLAAGAVMGWVFLVERLRWGGKNSRLGVAGAIMLLGNGLAFHGVRSHLRQGSWEQNRQMAASAEVAGIDSLLERVSPDARVATDYRLIAALSGRRVLWNVAHFYMDDARPPWWDAPWPLGLARVDTLVLPLDAPILGRLDDSWRLEAAASGYGLWLRTRPPAGGYPQPLP